MTIEEAATELMKTYSRFGVDKKELIRMMKNGVRNYDLTVASTFHGLRMMLSEQFHTQELFSQRDIAEMLDISEQEAVEQIEKAKKLSSRCWQSGAGAQTGGAAVTDQEIVGCLITEFSTFYRISPERIEKVFQLAKQELGDSMNAYYATQTLLVNMFRANSEPIWKISKQTETVMRKILSQ